MKPQILTKTEWAVWHHIAYYSGLNGTFKTRESAQAHAEEIRAERTGGRVEVQETVSTTIAWEVPA